MFSLGTIPLAAAIVALAAAIALGNWQMRRADGKIALQEAMLAAEQAVAVMPTDDGWAHPEALINHRLHLRGTWLAAMAVYLDNRPSNQGHAGLYVLMPLQLEGKNIIVMVNRGWLPRDAQQRTRIAPYTTPQGLVDVQGVALENEPKFMELGQSAPGRLGEIWQNFDFENFHKASPQLEHLTLVHLVVRQEASPNAIIDGDVNSSVPAPAKSAERDDGLVRDWPGRGTALQAQIDRHHGYAVQWYGLAALIVFLTLFYGYRNARKRHGTLN